MKNLVHNFCDCATCEKNQEKAEKWSKIDTEYKTLQDTVNVCIRNKEIVEITKTLYKALDERGWVTVGDCMQKLKKFFGEEK